MKCVRCKKKEGVIIIPSLEKKACNNCYSQIIEKRFNKTIKKIYTNLRNARLTVRRPSDEILKHLLIKRGVTLGKGVKIGTHTLDDLSISIIKSLNSGKDQIIKEPSPLEGISEEELKQYAKINKLKFDGNKRTGEDKKLHDFLIKINDRRPGVMYSIKDFIKKII
ncbi:MAG TPA: hypothetical protein VI790_05060 [Candidatus Nanoarchaeia archaeon]|nr:hypothetical protein [Candidatus Nanoarchaeia archaeon]